MPGSKPAAPERVWGHALASQDTPDASALSVNGIRRGGRMQPHCLLCRSSSVGTFGKQQGKKNKSRSPVNFEERCPQTNSLLTLQTTPSTDDPACQSTIPQLQKQLWHFFSEQNRRYHKDALLLPDRTGAVQGPTRERAQQHNAQLFRGQGQN